MKTPTLIITIIVVAVAAFYGGAKYTQNKTPAYNMPANMQNMRNLSQEERREMFEQMGTDRGAGQNRMGGNRFNADNLTGEIINMDENSITVKLSDGGSKIIFFSDKTSITKSVDGSIDDLAVGEQVMINGEANEDGSMTSRLIRMNPKRVER